MKRKSKTRRKIPTESVRVRNRWLDRLVAHARMKKMGMQHINKHDKGPSVFSRNWKEITSKRMSSM